MRSQLYGNLVRSFWVVVHTRSHALTCRQAAKPQTTSQMPLPSIRCHRWTSTLHYLSSCNHGILYYVRHSWYVIDTGCVWLGLRSYIYINTSGDLPWRWGSGVYPCGHLRPSRSRYTDPKPQSSRACSRATSRCAPTVIIVSKLLTLLSITGVLPPSHQTNISSPLSRPTLEWTLRYQMVCTISIGAQELIS